jgi:hypothetical protein
MTYQFKADLQGLPGGGSSDATHIRYAIYPPESITSGDSTATEAAAQLSTMFGASSGCDVKLLDGAAAAQPDAVEMKLGTFKGPAAESQAWGDVHCSEGDQTCCEEPEAVGPPEAPCDGNYRHYPGETFPATSEWEWTAPSTGAFLLRISANCDVGFYAQPDLCTRDADGVECADESLETCASAVAMTIITIDRAVHVKQTFDIPLPPGGLRRLRNLQSQGPSSQGEVVHLDRLQLAATLFQVSPLDCHV